MNQNAQIVTAIFVLTVFALYVSKFRKKIQHSSIFLEIVVTRV